MFSSVLRLLTALAFLVGCSGTIEGVRTDFASDDETSDERADAGRRGETARDGGSANGDDPAGADEEGAEPEDSGTETRNNQGIAFACRGDEEPPVASGLRIREIALYQTVKSTLMRDGSWVSQRTVPIVQGKRALLRVFVEPLLGYVRHPVRAVLTLRDGRDDVVLSDERTITTVSSDLDPASTFSFQVDGTALGPDTELSVALQEPECEAEGGSVADARFPRQGTQALGAQAMGRLRIVIVPVEINGRRPQTDAAELAKMRELLLSYYPVSELELTVRARPLVWTAPLRGTDGRSWSNLLNAVVQERRSDAPGADVYYYGMVQPTETFRSYCATGCILGIAPQTSRVTPSMQAALGASYADNQSYETMVHELGHAHGRGHAPCARGGSIEGVDTSFPERTGSTASWGWDARSNKLLPPTYKDIMGYCQPNWISAYTYAGLAARSSQVNLRAYVQAPIGVAASPLFAATRWHQLILYGDGTARWAGGVETGEPGGELEKALVQDASGSTIAEVAVSRVPLGDVNDQFLFVPEPKAGWSRLVIGGRVIELSEIASPL